MVKAHQSSIIIARVMELTAFLLILAMAGYLRLYHAPQTPGWYSDEGTLINIAQNIAQGKSQYLAVQGSTLLFARLPLFVSILSGLFRVFGNGIDTLRFFTGTLGVITVLIMYLTTRIVFREQKGFALLAAWILAIYPQQILYNRIGFSYNLLTPLVILIWFSLVMFWRNNEPKWLILTSLCLGIGSISDLMMFTLFPVLLVIVALRNWRHVLWSIPLAFLPFLVYCGWNLFTSSQTFWFDLTFTFTRLGKIPLIGQIPIALVNFAALLYVESWFIPAYIGLFLIKEKHTKMITIICVILPLLALARTVSLNGLGFYYISPLLPFIALGMAYLVYAAIPVILDTFSKSISWVYEAFGNITIKVPGRFLSFGTKLVSSLGIFLFILGPMIFITAFQVFQVATAITTPIDWALENPTDAQAVSNFINQHTTPNDLIICSPTLAWMFDTRVSDYQVTLAYSGVTTEHLPGDIPKERFAFDPSLTQAKFVIIDNNWRNWAALEMSEVAEMIFTVQTWQQVYQSGTISVYLNPK